MPFASWSFLLVGFWELSKKRIRQLESLVGWAADQNFSLVPSSLSHSLRNGINRINPVLPARCITYGCSITPTGYFEAVCATLCRAFFIHVLLPMPVVYCNISGGAGPCLGPQIPWLPHVHTTHSFVPSELHCGSKWLNHKVSSDMRWTHPSTYVLFLLPWLGQWAP